jgi:hypothetical protein
MSVYYQRIMASPGDYGLEGFTHDGHKKRDQVKIRELPFIELERFEVLIMAENGIKIRQAGDGD